jgi:hypothetical protein
VKLHRQFLLAACVFASLPALGVDGKAHLAVQVVEKNGDCRVADRVVVCLDVPRLLRELGVNPAQLIVVTSQGGGEGSARRVDHVVESIRAAGYRNVSAGGIGPAPEKRIPQDL